MAQTGTKRAKVRKGDQVVVMAGRDKGPKTRVPMGVSSGLISTHAFWSKRM